MRRAVASLLALALAACASDTPPRLLLGTTHTLEDSGLLTQLTTWFAEEVPGQHLAIVVAGSGEVLTMARRGDVDVVLSHSPDAETALLRDGRAESREPVMYNDFVILGPADDPADVRTAAAAADALARIAAAAATFISRGDDSGTHRRELALWSAAAVDPVWAGYIEAGAGMADALRLAAQRDGYILADRATYEILRDGLPLRVVFEGDAALRNQYSVLVIAGARNGAGARQFAEWIRSAGVQRRLAGYGHAETGRALFTPDARPGG